MKAKLDINHQIIRVLLSIEGKVQGINMYTCPEFFEIRVILIRSGRDAAIVYRNR